MNRKNAGIAAVFVLVAGVIVGLALWLSPGGAAPAQPGADTPAAELVASTTAETVAPAAVAPVEVATSSAVAVKPQPAAAVPKPAQQQAPAVVADEPAPEPPATGLPVPTTQPAQPEPWCYSEAMGHWYTAAQGCVVGSPDFREYR